MDNYTTPARGKIPVNVYPHRLRHTYACQVLDNGAPLDFIQGILGHEKESTTKASPDYYKAVGNYMCINSYACNGNITDVTYLERFIQNVLG